MNAMARVNLQWVKIHGSKVTNVFFFFTPHKVWHNGQFWLWNEWQTRGTVTSLTYTSV